MRKTASSKTLCPIADLYGECIGEKRWQDPAWAWQITDGAIDRLSRGGTSVINESDWRVVLWHKSQSGDEQLVFRYLHEPTMEPFYGRHRGQVPYAQHRFEEESRVTTVLCFLDEPTAFLYDRWLYRKVYGPAIDYDEIAEEYTATFGPLFGYTMKGPSACERLQGRQGRGTDGIVGDVRRLLSDESHLAQLKRLAQVGYFLIVEGDGDLRKGVEPAAITCTRTHDEKPSLRLQEYAEPIWRLQRKAVRGIRKGGIRVIQRPPR